MKNLINLKSKILFLLLVFITQLSVAQKKKVEKHKFLEGKTYNVQFYEMKAAGRGKALKSDIIIKASKVQCELMEDKLSLPPVNYKVTADSTYKQDEADVHVVSFEASFTEGKNSYEWQATITNYEIEGTVVQNKNGEEKKRYEFSGSEKAKKK